jgi:hypothetical protein
MRRIAGDEFMKSGMLSFGIFWLIVGSAMGADKSIALKLGPHLLIDDFLVAENEGVERQVMRAERFLKDPVVTSGPQHCNWQPWFTVLNDPSLPKEQRFRMWYNADVNPDPADAAFETKLAYLESADGIHWPGHFKQLEAEDVLWVSSVFDEGADFSKPDERYKMLYWSLTPKRYGPMVAASPDGLKWNLMNGAKPVFLRQNSFDDSWHAFRDPLRNRYLLMGKRHVVHGWQNEEGQFLLKAVRTFGPGYSQDFEKFTDLKVIFAPDSKDPGTTEFYGVTGFQVRGDLIIAFIQLLRDDLRAEGAPDEAVYQNFGNNGAGMGYTVVAWTRDGETWQRERQKDAILSPVPEVGVWDHAMAWISSAVPVDDEVYLYYAGYRWGHKLNRSLDRQIGLVKIKQDRYVARKAGERGGLLVTPLVTLDADKLTLNCDAEHGEIRVQVVDELNGPIYGLTFADCKPIKANSTTVPVEWAQSLKLAHGKKVRLQFSIKNASLFAFGLAKEDAAK